MPRVAVVTDTTHYLPRELVAAHGIHEVCLYVNWDGSHDREADLPDFDAFYDRLRTAAQLPTTSQPSVGDFLAVYEPLLEEGQRHRLDPPLRRHLRHRGVGAPGARAALERGTGGERIEVIDSRHRVRRPRPHGVAGRARRPRARRRPRRGAPREPARRASDLKIWFAVDTLEFLRRGGRIGARAGVAGRAR